jgi:hypothetical protein
MIDTNYAFDDYMTDLDIMITASILSLAWVTTTNFFHTYTQKFLSFHVSPTLTWIFAVRLLALYFGDERYQHQGLDSLFALILLFTMVWNRVGG